MCVYTSIKIHLLNLPAPCHHSPNHKPFPTSAHPTLCSQKPSQTHCKLFRLLRFHCFSGAAKGPVAPVSFCSILCSTVTLTHREALLSESVQQKEKHTCKHNLAYVDREPSKTRLRWIKSFKYTNEWVILYIATVNTLLSIANLSFNSSVSVVWV